MITFIVYSLLGLFCLKIIWNLSIPYQLARKQLKQISGGISIMPYVEITLLLLAIGAAALSKDGGWVNSPKNLAIWGAVAIAGSYVHLVIFGIILGWIATLLSRKR